MRRTMVMNTVELLLMLSSKPRYIRPMIPTSAAKIRISVVQMMPMRADFFISFWERTDMKRMMMCGMPK